jgi:hypothetical protein
MPIRVLTSENPGRTKEKPKNLRKNIEKNLKENIEKNLNAKTWPLW